MASSMKAPFNTGLVIFFLKFFWGQPILLSVEDKEVDGKGTETLIKNPGKTGDKDVADEKVKED